MGRGGVQGRGGAWYNSSLNFVTRDSHANLPEEPMPNITIPGTVCPPDREPFVLTVARP
jgi:hypothetical protein